MKLIKLYSNIESFHEVKFNPGLNFILGQRTNSKVINEEGSYNGVGKSLVIEIIHFCLGSNKINIFKEKLTGVIFYLDFEHNSISHTISRSCDDNQNITIDDKQTLKLTEFHKIIKEIIIPDLPDVSGIGYRSVISRYIRRNKVAYNKYDVFVKNEQEYNRNLVNSFVLGLDVKLLEKKMLNKSNQNILRNTKNSLMKDKMLIDYFKGKKDIRFKIADLKDKVDSLEKNISEFKIAENYAEIKEKADQLSQIKNKLLNEKIIVLNNLNKIINAQQREIKVTIADVLKIYSEAAVEVPEMIVKKLEEVEKFHFNLLKNRNLTLENQKAVYTDKKTDIETQLQNTNEELDQILLYLNEYGALNDYKTMIFQYNKLKGQLEKISDYNDLIKKYAEQITLKKKEKEEHKLEVKKYLEVSNELQESLMASFRHLSKVFYNDYSSGLTIIENDRDNKVSWNINANIEGDSSDGINEVKIYCFDMTLLIKGLKQINFIFHDSRLFSDMDPRKKYKVIKTALEITKKNNVQYISSWNEDMINSIQGMVEEESYSEIVTIIKENTILTLKDDKPENKLLGFQIDLTYDK